VASTDPAHARLARAAEAIAAGLPFVVAVLRAADAPQWRDDLAIARAVSLASTPGSGLVTTLGLSVARFVPLGPLTYRGALMSTVALAVVAWLAFRLCRSVLDDVIEGPVLSPALAAVAALICGLSPALQREATVAGGSMVATALALGAITLVAERRGGPAGLAVGALLAGLALESPPTFLVTCVALLARVVLDRSRAPRRQVAFAVAGMTAVGVVIVLPFVLRQTAHGTFVDLGVVTSPRELVALDVNSLRARGISAWMTDIGPVALALTALGALAAILRRWAWPAVLPLAALVTADLLVPARTAGVLSADACGGVRAMSVIAAAVLSAIGVQAIVTTLLASRLPFARAAAALLVVLDLALAAVAGEESALSADRADIRGADAWTTAAMERLPAGALVLVRDDSTTWRALSARLAAGVRPDVMVVPLPLLARGRLAAALLVEEPALAPLLRDLSATGAPSEYALSSLADVRPLYVELDPAWDRRLAAHLVPEKMWLRYAPQPLGSSDRRLAQNDDGPSLARVIAAADRRDAPDLATLEVLAAHTREQAQAAAIVGDREGMRTALERLSTLHAEPPPGDPIWSQAEPPRRPDARPGPRARSR
jgi:hypothetical protein